MHQSVETIEEEREPHNDCIGNLEHHVHKVFALVRVPGEDFVYSASIDLFNKLDDYCDEQGMLESRPPFLIKGESGTGKSALLSNWLQRRERTLMRSRGGNSDYFIFWHAVGCSRQSMNVNLLIKRLIVELKTRFELTRPLPKQQDRYSWELPRFLDLAAKRGKVIIVIDGLNRLVNNDGTEDTLAWLPLVFPPNVRVILSVTIPTAVSFKMLGHAVKAMRVMSQFTFGKDALAARDAVTEGSGTSTPFVVGGSRGSSPSRPPTAPENGMSAADVTAPASGTASTGTASLAGIVSKKPFAALASAMKAASTTSGEAPAAANAAAVGGRPSLMQRSNSFGGEVEPKKPPRKSRILAELERRGIPVMQMTPLNKQLCRSLVESFIHKSVNSESASLATGPYISAYLSKQASHRHASMNLNKKGDGGGGRSSMVLLGSGPGSADHHGTREASEEVTGFLLFENQIKALLNHAQGGTPLFLRLFLRCLQYAVSRGYSLWAVYEDWMKAKSVPELLIRILRTLENDFKRTRSAAQTACDKTIAAGGLPALKQLYSWHPAFQHMETTKPSTADRTGLNSSRADGPGGVGGGSGEHRRPSMSRAPTGLTGRQARRMSTQSGSVTGSLQALLSGEAGDHVALATIAAAATESATGTAPVDDGAKYLSSEVRQNLGDQAWYAADNEANSKLQKGLRQTEEATSAALSTIRLQANEDGTDVLQALVKSIRQAYDTAVATSSVDEPGVGRVSQIYNLGQIRLRSNGRSFDSASMDDDSCFEEDYEDTEDDQDSLVSIDERSATSDHTVHSKTIKITQELIPPAMRSEPRVNTGYNATTGEAMATTSDTAAAAAHKSAKSPFKAMANALAGHAAAGVTGGVGTGSVYSVGSPGNNGGANAAAVDPSEGLHTLPIYLRGGVDTTGFGDILGNALALLYASRQGLRESELWRMLSLLQYKSERDTHLTQEMKAANHAIVRRTALIFLQEKGPLTDLFKAEDITRTSYISRKQVLRCVRKINPEITREDLIKTLEFADLHTPNAPVNVTSTNHVHYYQDRDLLIGDKVHYPKLFVVLNKLNKLLKFSEVGAGKTGALLATSKPGAPASVAVQKSLSTAKTSGVSKSQSADDDYEHFNLSAIGADSAAAAAHNHSTAEEGAGAGVAGGASQEHSSTFLTTTVSELDGSARPLNSSIDRQVSKLSIELNDPEEEAEEEENYSLGPVIEESLLAILSALGVLHDPENKVLILPSDSEPFRQVIYNNYILKRGGGTMSYWHGIIVKHFQTEPNSLRKCEELPWHLKICRKWSALRDALVDLEAFDLMTKTDLKSELIDYWVLLTEGPLPFPDPAADSPGREGGESGRPQSGGAGRAPGPKSSGRRSKDDDGNESTYSNVLRDIDHAVEQNISLKDARRRKYQHHVVPFDIVEELNKSLELWVVNMKPPTHKIHRMIIQVAKFLYEFSRSANASPDFLRLGIDLESVKLFASALGSELRGGEAGLKKAGADGDDEHSLAGSLMSPAKTVNTSSTAPTSPVQAGSAVGQGTGKKGDQTGKGQGQSHSAAGAVLFGDTSRHDVPKFPTPAMLSSNLYLYLRWIWIQYPWIGLHSAPDVAVALKHQRQEEEKHRYDNDKKKGVKSAHTVLGGGLTATLGSRPGTAEGHAHGHAAPNAATQHGHDTGVQEGATSEDPSLASFAHNADSAMLLRVWNVKKSDPTVPVYVKSHNRKLAAIKPRSTLTSGLERNVQVSFEKLYEEITSPSHIAKIRLGFKCKDKYRRPFKEEVEFNKNIPFAYHGVRAMKAGSLFPTYEKFLAESNQQRLHDQEEEAARAGSRHKRRAMRKFDVDAALQQQLHKDPKGATAATPFMLVELDDEIRRMNNDEYITKHKVEQIGGGVVKDEIDLEMAANMDRVARMKTIRNKLMVIYNEKVRTIHELHRQVVHRHETDQQLIDEVVNSEVLLRHLNDRNVAMEKDLAEAERIHDGYQELLKVLKNNPPYIESHVKALELEVQLAEKQFEELCEHRNKLYNETEQTDQHKREQLLEKIEYFQQARYEVSLKKKHVLRQMRLLKGPNKRDNKSMNRRGAKSGKVSSGRARARSDSMNETDSSGSDSDASRSDKKEIQLTAPVMHFLNAIVRKTTFNEAVVKETDTSLEDIKRRFDEEEALGPRMLSAKHRRLNRMGSMDSMNTTAFAAYAADAAAAATTTTAAAGATAAPSATVPGTSTPVLGATGAPGDDGSVHGGSQSSRNGGGGGTGSGAGSLASRDSAARHHRSFFVTPGDPGQPSRRASGFANALPALPMEMSTPLFMPASLHSGGILGGGLHSNAPSQPPTPLKVGGTVRPKKLAGDQLTQLREAVRLFLPIEAAPDRHGGGGGHTHHHHHRGDGPKNPFHRAYDLLMEKTSSSSADELIERFTEGQALLQSLRKQQTLVDSRLAQLQSEHAELFTTFNDLAFITDEAKAEAAGGANAASAVGSATAMAESVSSANEDTADLFASSDRYLDNQLFAREVRMNQLLRNKDRAEQIVSDVRNAVGYLINLMVINSKLLYALPKSEPPVIKSSEDIMAGVSWFEDRIMALSEALAMDANKPTGANTADDNKPLSERQMDLALLVQKMNLDQSRPGSRTNSRQGKKRGGISSSLINAEDEPMFVSPAHTVMVPPVGRVDKIFDSKMGKLVAERDRVAEAHEAMQAYRKDDENNATLVQNFLNEGLNIKETKDLARSANLLVNKHSGRTGSYGLVLENLLAAKGPAYHPAIKRERAEKGHGHGDGAEGVGAGNSLGSPTAMRSSVYSHTASVSSSAVLNKGEMHLTGSVKSPTHASTHANTASTENGRRHSGHSRSSSPVNL